MDGQEEWWNEGLGFWLLVGLPLVLAWMAWQMQTEQTEQHRNYAATTTEPQAMVHLLYY